MAFRDSNLSAPEIAAELGVDYLLEGRITRNEDTVRVFASLINAADGSSVWTSPYDRELNDPFALQIELAETVAERLSVTFGVGDFDREAGRTKNLEAYDFYLAARGSALVTNIDATIALFDRAVAIDPEFGLAHLYTARVMFDYLIVRGVLFDVDLSAGDAPQTSLIQQMARLQQRGRTALERARALDPRAVALDAEAQTLDGYTQFWQYMQNWRLRSVGDAAAADAVLEKYDTIQAIAAMRRLYENPAEMRADSPAIYTGNVAMLAAADGDVEFALEMWRRTLLGSPSNPSLGSSIHLAFVWTSLMAEMRRHPDFESLMSEMNLPGYWRQYGWPEHCRPAEPEGFECS